LIPAIATVTNAAESTATAHVIRVGLLINQSLSPFAIS
jgi:hypothetical protein